MQNKNIKKILLFLLPVTVVYFCFFIFPLGSVLFTSLNKWNGISKMEFVGLENYKKLLSDETFRLSIKNNIIWALCGGFIQIPLAAMVALILAREPKGWKALRTVYFLPNIISAVAIAMMWKAIYNPMYGFLNAFLKLLVSLNALGLLLLFNVGPIPEFIHLQSNIWVLYEPCSSFFVVAQNLLPNL